MKITALFVQYIYNEGPELYAAVDEFTEDENPSYLEDKITEVKNNSDIVEFRLIDIVVPTKAILEAFKRTTIEGGFK